MCTKFPSKKNGIYTLSKFVAKMIQFFDKIMRLHYFDICILFIQNSKRLSEIYLFEWRLNSIPTKYLKNHGSDIAPIIIVFLLVINDTIFLFFFVKKHPYRNESSSISDPAWQLTSWYHLAVSCRIWWRFALNSSRVTRRVKNGYRNRASTWLFIL